MSDQPFAPSRRSLLAGLAAALSAPVVVRAESLMQIRGVVQPWPRDHRWLASYCIGTDEIVARADTYYGQPVVAGRPIVGSSLSASGNGFCAPLMPRSTGLWVPNEKGRRALDRLMRPALDALYQSFDIDRINQLHTAEQHNVAMTLPAGLLSDKSLWEEPRGYNHHLYEDRDD